MKKLITSSLLLCSMMFFVAGSAFAVKPPDVIDNSNGFPSGFHFNLNIHGKKLEFNCPEPFDASTECPVPDPGDCNTHDGEYGKYVNEGTETEPVWVWKYSNSLFIPEEGGTDIKIYVESGKKNGNGKNATLNPEVLEVIDACTADFDNLDTDAARIQLPPCDGGYRVYARALAKNTDDPSLTIRNACLNSAEDENGTPLFFLGEFGEGWVETPTTFIREKRKKPMGTEITGLFKFTGDVCYVAPAVCTDDDNADINCAPVADFCVTDIEPADGIYDFGAKKIEIESILQCPVWKDDNGICYWDLNNNDINDECEPKVPNPGSCPTPAEVPAECSTYTDQWIFDIPDFAQYFWDIDNDGLKLLQIRFYPNCDDLGQ